MQKVMLGEESVSFCMEMKTRASLVHGKYSAVAKQQDQFHALFKDRSHLEGLGVCVSVYMSL